MRHREYMQRALTLAEKARGRTSPNPMVGAVIVRGETIIGEGYHRAAGEPHAEVMAIRTCAEPTAGATIYITLEPCCHHGKTPPCTDAILNAGIAEVYYAVADPNPLVAGNGQRLLEKNGVKVHRGILEEAALALNRPFFHYIRHKTPYVTVKYAMSLDGKIATASGQSQWISSEPARLEVHRLRNVVDAILVGTGTALSDNPSLTTRLPGQTCFHPKRIVLDRTGKIPLTHRLFDPGLPGETLVATSTAMPNERAIQLRERGVAVLECSTRDERIDLPYLLEELARRKVVNLMVEGGGCLLGAFLEQQLIREVWAFLCPKIIGGSRAPSPFGDPGFERLEDALRLDWFENTLVGDDFLIKGWVKS